MTTENIDQSEIDKFAALASQWWDKNGNLKALHDINPIRMDFISAQIDLKDKAVLDVGCGGGILTESLAEQGAHVTGIDMSASTIAAAEAHRQAAKLPIDYQTISVADMAVQHAHEFDIITCLEMLEHVPDPAAIIKECVNLVKPGGHLFFSTINRTFKAYALAIIAGEYLLNIVPRGTHDYDKLIQPAELSRWLRACNVDINKITGISYNPLLRKGHLVKDVSINYMMHCIRDN